jgi:hypothetical protein
MRIENPIKYNKPEDMLQYATQFVLPQVGMLRLCIEKVGDEWKVRSLNGVIEHGLPSQLHHRFIEAAFCEAKSIIDNHIGANKEYPGECWFCKKTVGEKNLQQAFGHDACVDCFNRFD